jgi:hypothetical protein
MANPELNCMWGQGTATGDNWLGKRNPTEQHYLLIVLVILAISSCGLPENAMTTAIAKTQPAIPTETFIPSYVQSMTPSITPTGIPTQTPTYTPIPFLPPMSYETICAMIGNLVTVRGRIIGMSGIYCRGTECALLLSSNTPTNPTENSRVVFTLPEGLAKNMLDIRFEETPWAKIHTNDDQIASFWDTVDVTGRVMPPNIELHETLAKKNYPSVDCQIDVDKISIP